jgi:F-type H+-transporting ATPase subunit a
MSFLVGEAWASEAAHHASDASHGAGHGGGHDSSLHVQNAVGVLAHYLPGPVGDFLLRFENVIFTVLVVALLALVFGAASRRAALVPGRLQLACEGIVEGLSGFVTGILGPEGRKYVPFLGTMFLYIWTMNLIGLVPLMKSNTANSITLPGPVPLPVPTTTVALALIVFVYVQCVGVKNQGLLGYLDHMAGTPRDVFGWVMVPIMLPIHLIGELAKPFSLTFRLFCNIMGGHILVAVFIGMAIGAAFIPFQAPFLIFEIATSTIQAFVFTLLSTVYIAMMLPHHDHGEEGHHEAPAVGDAHAAPHAIH